jgi:hypothetical protein
MLDVLDSIEWSEPWTSAKAEQWWIDRGFALRD